jgi:hypothetical protein
MVGAGGIRRNSLSERVGMPAEAKSAHETVGRAEVEDTTGSLNPEAKLLLQVGSGYWKR